MRLSTTYRSLKKRVYFVCMKFKHIFHLIILLCSLKSHFVNCLIFHLFLQVFFVRRVSSKSTHTFLLFWWGKAESRYHFNRTHFISKIMRHSYDYSVSFEIGKKRVQGNSIWVQIKHSQFLFWCLLTFEEGAQFEYFFL